MMKIKWPILVFSEYERQEELDVLVNKAQSIGLDEKESARLDWLLDP